MFDTDGVNDVGQDIHDFDAPELSPEHLTEHYAGIIASALTKTGLVEVREIQANLVNQVHILARVQEKHARQVAQVLIRSILFKTLKTDIDSFCGKQFLVKDNDVVYAWVFSFGGKDVQYMARVVCEAIEEAVPQKRLEVLEAPLMGPGTPRSAGPGSRGAAPIRG